MEFYQKHENTSDIHGIFICLKIQGNSKFQLNKIAARWPAKAVTQFFFS